MTRPESWSDQVDRTKSSRKLVNRSGDLTNAMRHHHCIHTPADHRRILEHTKWNISERMNQALRRADLHQGKSARQHHPWPTAIVHKFLTL
jgi:hypothetical protein